MRATMHVRTPELTLAGPLPLLTGRATLRSCAVGSWDLSLDARSPEAVRKGNRLRPGGGVVLLDDETGNTLLSGPMRRRTRTAAADGPVRTLAAEGATDELHLKLNVLPDPSQPDTGQTTVESYIHPGGPAAAETVLRRLVNLQAGPGAIVQRRVAGLILAAANSPAVGGLVTAKVRYEPGLLETLHELAVAGGVRWRVLWQDGALVFQVYLPRDRSRRIRLSRRAGSLRSYTDTESAPDVTDVTVLGGGDGTARVTRHRAITDPAALAWGVRIEATEDQRQASDTAELDQAGDAALADGAAARTLEVEVGELPHLRLGRDYWLDDVVTVLAVDGPFTAAVEQVDLLLTPYGWTGTPLVGTALRDPVEPPAARRTRRVERRVSKLEVSK